MSKKKDKSKPGRSEANFDWIAHLQTIREITEGNSTGGNAVLEERASYKA